jgi:hypothetical protein
MSSPSSPGKKKSSSAALQPATTKQKLFHMEEMEVRGMWLDSDEEDQESFFNRSDAVDMLSGKNLTWRQRFRDILEGQPHNIDKFLHICFNILSLTVIITSIAIFCVQSLPSYIHQTGRGLDGLDIGEFICIGFFITEIILRLYCVPWHVLKNFFFVIDVIAVVGFFVDVVIDLAGVNSGAQGASFVRSFRLIRIFRVFKLSRHSKSLQLVFVVVKNSFSGLTSLLLPIVMIVVVASTFIYFFEILDMSWNSRTSLWIRPNGNPSTFQSIPDAIWFACVTITTVGYGDLVPASAAGKCIGVLLAFAGVLILSFPNIVLGGNLQLAFRLHYMTQSRRLLGRKFRKVVHLVRFVRCLKERADERRQEREDMKFLAEQESAVAVVEPFGSDGGPAINLIEDRTESSATVKASSMAALPSMLSPFSQATKKMFYMMPKGEMELYRNDDVPMIDNDNIRSWSYSDISAVEWLQRLLELCSGVGTTEELATSFATDKTPPPSPADIALIGLYLMEADYVQVFAFRRQAVNMLFCLTTLAVQELMLHKEDLHAECIRGVEMAKMVWKRTTGMPAVFVLQPLQSTYLQWACAERMVDNALCTPQVDMKVSFGGAGKGRSGSTARRSSSLTGASQLSRRNTSAVSDIVSREAAKARMKTILEQQKAFILKLQAEIAHFEQNVVNAYGF